MARPNVTEVAGRLLALRSTIIHAWIAPPRELLEQSSSTWSPADWQDFTAKLEEAARAYWSRVEASPIWGYLSPSEQKFAKTTALTMSDQDRIDAAWRMESAQVLMWALNIIPELPPLGVQADMEILKDPALSPAEKFLASPLRLRPDAEIDHARAVAELWHWRSRTEELIRIGRPFPSDDALVRQGFRSYMDIVRAAAEAARERGDVALTIDDDFGVLEKPYARLSTEEWSQVRSTSIERHRALNLLYGYSANNDWDSTPTET